MKMCFITSAMDETSGWGRYAADVIQGARHNGHTVSVVPVSGGVSVLGSFCMALMRCRKADIVYAIDGWPFGAIAWLVTRLWRNRLIIGAIGTYTIAPFGSRTKGLLMCRAYDSADAVIAISRYTRGRLLQHVPGAKVTVITPGIAYHQWHHQDDGHDRMDRLISVGAIKTLKGYDTILKAFARVRQKFPELRWVIVGDQAYRSYVRSLKERAVVLGVADAIDWYEHISDERLRELYASSRLFVLLSENRDGRFEGFGIVFLEAAAAGLPVIGTRDNGIEDAVGDNGVLVAQRDVQAATDAIIGILNNDERWQYMSKASQRWASQHSLDNMYTAHEGVYRRISVRT